MTLLFQLNDVNANILNVDDYFAKLINVTNTGDFLFQFTYKIKQTDAVKFNAFNVNVSAVTQILQIKSLFENATGSPLSTLTLINNILLRSQMIKSTLQKQQEYTIAQKTSDITAFISNSALNLLKNGTPIEQIPELNSLCVVQRSVHDIEQSNESISLLQSIRNIKGEQVEERDIELIMQHMLQSGVDPSYVTQLTHRSVSTSMLVNGLLQRQRTHETITDAANKLLNYYLNTQASVKSIGELQGNEFVNVLVTQPVDEIEIHVLMMIPSIHSSSSFTVRFSLVDTSGKTIDVVTKHVDVPKHVQLFKTPKKPPIVKFMSSETTSTINLEIKQIDPGATGIKLYKKVLSRASIEVDDYLLIGSYDLTAKQQALRIVLDKPILSSVIYRVVPVGSGNLGHEYTNVVINPVRIKSQGLVALNVQNVSAGIDVEVRNFYPDVTAVQLFVRNLTTFDKKYRALSEPIMIDESTRIADYISIVDTSVFTNMIYEYAAKVFYRNGISEIVTTTVIEFIHSEDGKIDTKITDVEIFDDEDEPNVSFNIRSLIPDKNADIVLNLLQRQDIKEFFADDIKKEREFLSGLLAHSVQRVNLTTGEREDFGIIVDEFFDDKQLRNNSSVKPLNFGNSYRYEASTLIRAPETMFANFVKEVVDDTTKKTYRFKPSKFLHPVTLIDGIIASGQGLNLRYAKDAMAYGNIGSHTSIDVSFDSPTARIKDQIVSRFDKALNVVSWYVEGNVNQIDHFLIMKDVQGTRTLLGKTHSEFQAGAHQYIHVLTDKDAGELKYVIIPVFNDYKIGEIVVTNSIIV